MIASGHKAVIWGIWGLLGVYAALELIAWVNGDGHSGPLATVAVSAGWIVIISLAVIATRHIDDLSMTLVRSEDAHRATRTQLKQLQTQNAVLQVVSQSVDVPLSFHALAQRITPLVPCDRVGLALLTADGQEFQTYTARVMHPERRLRPRPEVVFKPERTAIGMAVRSREAMFIDDTREGAADYLDVNILHSTGFRSALIVPLVAEGRAVGTLNVVSRKTKAFRRQHADTLLPIAEIFAVAHVAHQAQAAVARHKTMESMTELTEGISAEISSSLQTIIARSDPAGRGSRDAGVQRDMDVIAGQAQRIRALLERLRSELAGRRQAL